EARQRQGLSQDKIAKPEFTKSYVSAVERGKARPSLKALELMAARLGIPTSELLALPLPAEGGVDPRAQAEAIALQLDQVRRAIDTGHARQALDQLDELETSYGEGLPDASPEARFRLHYGRGRCGECGHDLSRRAGPGRECAESGAPERGLLGLEPGPPRNRRPGSRQALCGAGARHSRSGPEHDQYRPDQHQPGRDPCRA